MRKLGKGLSELGLTELLSGSMSVTPPAFEIEYDKIHYLGLDTLVPGKYQPRRSMDQAALSELAESIRAQGILQPLIVREQFPHYEIIAGERRWRAARLAGLDKIPAIIRNIPDQTAMAFGLIENIQRRDLNALEEAEALQRLLQEFQLTHEAVAEAVGKSRVTISNLLRLLQLNPEVKNLLAEGQLEMGHARALLALEGAEQNECAQRVVRQQLSVRQTEALVRQFQKTTSSSGPHSLSDEIYPHALQQDLAEKLHAKVLIRHNSRGKGKIVIHYQDLDQLEDIFSSLRGA